MLFELSRKEARIIPTARALGYEYTATRLDDRPLREYILPMDPFKRFGPVVIVTELVLDDEGVEVGRKKILRWLPKKRVARYA